MSETLLNTPSKANLLESEDQPQPDPRDEAIASLQGKLVEIADQHLEERFIWVLVVLVLADSFIFSKMDNFAGPLVIGIFELVGVIILADRCKVDTVAPLIDKLTGFAHKISKVEKPKN